MVACEGDNRAVNSPLASLTSVDWPNEPAGFTVLTDEPFDALDENGWGGVQRTTTNGSGLSVVTDALAPHSRDNVLQFRYAEGFPGGETPGVEYYDPASPVQETYFGFWWKPSNPWENHEGSGVNKLAMLFPQTQDVGVVYLMMFNDGSGYTIQVEPTFPLDTRRLPPNQTATSVDLGTWHQIEWYVKYSTTGNSDGVTKWWLDGVLQGVYTDLHMPDGDPGFIEYQLGLTWGGVGGTKADTADFQWYDHAHISEAP
jgi:hypothetical protein